MNWKLLDKREYAIRSYIEANGRTIYGLVYTCIVTNKYKFMAWAHGDNIRKAVNAEEFNNVFEAIALAESTMLSISDEIQSSSAVWQEV